MSNSVQDARRELKISPCFVGTVAHLHPAMAAMAPMANCNPGGPTVFDARAIDSCAILRVIKGDRLLK
jgi:hypothetical protein